MTDIIPENILGIANMWDKMHPDKSRQWIVAQAIITERELASNRAKQMERLEKAFDDMIMMVDFEKCKLTIAFETAEETEAAQKALSEAIGWETIGEPAF